MDPLAAPARLGRRRRRALLQDPDAVVVALALQDPDAVVAGVLQDAHRLVAGLVGRCARRRAERRRGRPLVRRGVHGARRLGLLRIGGRRLAGALAAVAGLCARERRSECKREDQDWELLHGGLCSFPAAPAAFDRRRSGINVDTKGD
jgi:hypothetical protein